MKNEIVGEGAESVEELKDNSPKLTDKEVMDKYLNDETIKANHVKIAEFLEKRFRGNWFTLEQIVKKTNVKSSSEAMQMMLGLHLFGLSTSVDNNGSSKFKITLSSEERIKVLEGHKQNHLDQISLLDAEIAELKSKA